MIDGGADPTAPHGWAAVQRRFGDAIPAYPGHDVVRPVRIDSPPLLGAALSTDAMVGVCCEAYRSTITMLFGECKAIMRGQGAAFLKQGTRRDGRRLVRKELDAVARVLKPLDAILLRGGERWRMVFDTVIALKRELKTFRPPVEFRGTDSRRYNAVAAAAEALRAHGIPPLGWVAYACATWTEYVVRTAGTVRGQPPGLAWVYAAKRVATRADACRAEGHGSGVTWVGPMHRTLVARWDAMRSELTSVQPDTIADARLIVLKHFPHADGYDATVMRAQKESRDTQRFAGTLLEAGTGLW